MEHRRLTFWKWKIEEEELLIKYAHFRWNFTLREKILDCCKLSGVVLTMCYQVMFAWQWQAMQETLSHVTSKMESIKWTGQILKTTFTFISLVICASDMRFVSPISVWPSSLLHWILMNWYCIMDERWHQDDFMKTKFPWNMNYYWRLHPSLITHKMPILKAFVLLSFTSLCKAFHYP